MRKLLLSFFLASCSLLFPHSVLYGQERAVGGVVLDAETDEPLGGVTVVIGGDVRGVVTDNEGRFRISAAEGQTLDFFYIGYESRQIVAGAQTNLTVRLARQAEMIDEILIVGYGVQKKSSAVASIVQAHGDDILKTGAVTSISQALQGMLPGVVSISESGKPGADAAEIIIRGKSSWISSSPLTLVDGVERDIDDIDPNEVETISVLKDASATAVYGVKGANGVILVTTKRGSEKKPNVNFSANFGLKQPTTRPEYADYVTTMKMWNEAAANDKDWGALIPESTIAAWENAYATGNYGPLNPYFPEVDWWEEMVRDVGFQQQYNINVGGGNKFMNYFASLGFLNDGDVFKTYKTELYDPSFNYKRYNWRANFDFKLTKTTTFSVNLSGKQGNRSQPGYRVDGYNIDDNDSFGQPQFFRALYSAPRHIFPIYWPDDSYGVAFNGSGNLRMEFDKGQRIYKSYQNYIDTNLKQDLSFITKGLSANAKFSYSAYSSTESHIQLYTGGNFGQTKYIGWYRRFDYSQPLAEGGYALAEELRLPDNYFQGDNQSGTYDQVMNKGYARNLYYEVSLNYGASFGKHNVSALALMNRYQNETLESNSSTDMKFQERDEAWVVRATYNWSERYLFEFNGAYTGSQKFARGKRFQFFPSYSAGWRISEEPFIKNHAGKYLTNLKVRYSYGTVGYDKAADSFTYIQMFTNEGGGVKFGNSESNNFGPLYREGQMANVNATWETARKQNLGVEFGFMNRLTATVDFFSERREGILMSIATPGWFGSEAADGNIGRTKSHGYEIELGWRDNIGRNFNYWLKGNYSFTDNRIVFRDDGANKPGYQKWAGKPIGVQNRLIVGGYYESLDDIFNYATPNSTSMQSQLIPGDFLYVDYNADGKIEDATDVAPMRYTNYPRRTFGWSLGFNWKGLSFSAMFYGVSGVYKSVVSEMLWDNLSGVSGNFYANPNVTGRWTPETASTAVKPALHSTSTAGGYSQKGATTYASQNASYIRLKNLEISYMFDRKLIKSLGMSKLQIYTNGNNLITFTTFNKQLDPESNSVSLYPLVRRYNLGLRLSF